MNTKRSYEMTKRAQTSEDTLRSIYLATASLWREIPIAEITLDKVAERAGVSVRTVIRRFGSKEGLFEACINEDAGNIKADRLSVEVGNIPDIIDILLKHYEESGDATIRTLAVEDQLDVAKNILQEGRRFHRMWCAQVFEPYLPESEHQDYDEMLNAFVAACDLYLWKLFRKDLNQSLNATRNTFLRLINGLVNESDIKNN